MDEDIRMLELLNKSLCYGFLAATQKKNFFHFLHFSHAGPK